MVKAVSAAAVSREPQGPRVNHKSGRDKRGSYRPQIDDLADTHISDFKTFEKKINFYFEFHGL